MIGVGDTMNREEAETLYKELLKKIAKYYAEQNMSMVNATFREIEKVRQRIFNLDVADAIEEYQEQLQTTMKGQK